MITVLRKIFGIVALIWVGCVGLTLIIFGLALITNMAGQRTAQSYGIEMAAAGMFLISHFTSIIGIPSCLAWFGLKLVQVLGQSKNAPRYPNMTYGLEPQRVGAVPALNALSITNRNAERILSAIDLDNQGRTPGARVMTSPLNLARIDKLPHRDYVELPQPPRAERPTSVYTYEAPGQHLCPNCGLRPALFYCRSHQSPLCLNCVGSHDMPSQCVYVPGWRTEAAFSGQTQFPGATYSYEAPGLPLCPQCSVRPALFSCRTHRLSLCLNCMGSHDVRGDCCYDPSWRAAYSRTHSPSRPTRRKTGDVFGIS